MQHVDVVSVGVDPLALWSPAVGAETTSLLARSLSDDAARAQVSKQSASILSRCRGPKDLTGANRTGLVVGYVQSGKTLSFTALMAMARDNGFPLVILLAGTKKNLHEQTAGRLAKDLEVERVGGLSPWYLLNNPVAGHETGHVANFIRDSLQGTVPEKFRRTTVITVMKNATRLTKLRELLTSMAQYGLTMDQVPVLVVDDEADQAGLNAAVAKDDETATYSAIVKLREALPRHSYVMYTATPQAPLLVNLADALSPDFVSVLKPGPGYTGGQYFFGDHKSSFLKMLSTTEVSTALDPGLVEPPDSLEKALATFLLVLAGKGGNSQVSMLVHPSHTQGLQDKYGQFVTTLLHAWRALLTTPGLDRQELVDAHFTPAYADLVKHASSPLPPIDDLLTEVPFWISATQVKVVNSGTSADGEIKWATAPAWVLVGGNKLDRGFTVEGLAVTYMPRSVGTGLADSIQQRARFFGYKQAYGDLCRAWLAPATADAFEHYVEHEQILRKELEEVSRQGIPLKKWTRQMLLDPRFKPCRRAVVDLPYLHGRIPGDTWVSVSRLGQLGTAGANNFALVQQMVLALKAPPVLDPRDTREGDRRNSTFQLDLPALLEHLLVDWEGHLDDRALVTQAVLLLRARLDEQPGLLASVTLMDGLKVRERSLRADDITVNNLQQGRSPKGPYQGDKEFFTPGVVSVQVHNVQVKGPDGRPVGPSVPGISLRVPASLAGGVLVQHGDGQ
ncbi:Z1 domain-containing protein [Knoellia sp. CPCC 206450]|uniref:Z1 domain-containing protein n=1 Tax=Knoellia tibetensis TaxID=3404798 RepID=UPI003B42E0AE